LMWESFGREKNYWREKLLKGKELLKENAKEGLIESLHWEL
jgi:hypothetical protein